MTKQSTGEPFFVPVLQPLIIVCANSWLVSNVLPSCTRLLAIGSHKLRIRPNSAFGTQVLMKFSFKNVMLRSLERTPALKDLPLAQQDSSASGPFIEIE